MAPRPLGPVALAAVLLLAVLTPASAQAPPPAGSAGPAGEIAVSFHVTLAPSWFDPPPRRRRSRPSACSTRSTTRSCVRCPGRRWAPSLAESWTREPRRAHVRVQAAPRPQVPQRRPVTAEDVKFSFERYKGAGAKEFQARVRAGGGRRSADRPLPPEGAVAGLHDVLRHHGHRGRHRGAEEVRRRRSATDGFRKQPIGAGPYRFVSHQPGVEVVLEAYTGYWRHVPNVKR